MLPVSIVCYHFYNHHKKESESVTNEKNESIFISCPGNFFYCLFDINTRMSSITNGVYGIGKTFRNNQSKSCTFPSGGSCHHNHGGDYASNDSYCNCKVATSDIAGTTGGIQCFGYARFVFYQLFGLSISTSMKTNNYELTSLTNIVTVGQSTNGSSSTAKASLAVLKEETLFKLVLLLAECIR